MSSILLSPERASASTSFGGEIRVEFAMVTASDVCDDGGPLVATVTQTRAVLQPT